MGAGENEWYAAGKTFQYLDRALEAIGYSDDNKNRIHKLIASILHLGNIKIEQSGSESVIPKTAHQPLQYASDLLNVSTEELEQTLLTRHMKINNMKTEM